MSSEPPQEQFVEERARFDGRLLHVRRDAVRLPSGNITDREVVEHPGAVAVVALTADNQVLLVRQFRYPAGRSMLEIPAGTRESGEPAVETARRELIEETGFSPGQLIELTTFYSSPGYSTEQITLFRADNCIPVNGARDEEEPAHLESVPLSEIASLLTAGDDRIVDGKTLIGLLWLLRDAAEATSS